MRLVATGLNGPRDDDEILLRRAQSLLDLGLFVKRGTPHCQRSNCATVDDALRSYKNYVTDLLIAIGCELNSELEPVSDVEIGS
jgi:hypothetical protein